MFEKIVLAGLFLVLGSTSTAVDEDRVLFDFTKPDAAGKWLTVNDGVMGGLSDGRFKITESKTMEFYGRLSLENNGGFASVRSGPTKIDLKKGDLIALRVRGDGREYRLNLYVPRRRMAFSYRWSFKTPKDKWIEIRAPLDKFVATSFGRVLPKERLNPGEVNAIGFLLGDKKAGPFKLEVDWVKVTKAKEPDK